MTEQNLAIDNNTKTPETAKQDLIGLYMAFIGTTVSHEVTVETYQGDTPEFGRLMLKHYEEGLIDEDRYKRSVAFVVADEIPEASPTVLRVAA